MSAPTTPAIRLSVTDDVQKALDIAKKVYPALSYPEILKIGLSKIVNESNSQNISARYSLSDLSEMDKIRKSAAYAVGYEYLSDPEEDIYDKDYGSKVHFS